MHFYIYRKVVSQTNFPNVVDKTLIIFFVFMVISPILSRINVFKDDPGITYSFTVISSLWIGFVFYFFLVNSIVDLSNVLGKLVCFVTLRKKQFVLIPQGQLTLFSTFIAVLVICTYGYFEALNIGVTTLTLKTPKLPKNLDKLVIAQISDLHLGILVREKRLENVITIMQNINPDIIVSTGDLVDENVDSMQGLTKLFKAINPRFGKYAVTGNHEFYAGIELSEKFTKDSEFVLLRNQYMNVSDLMNIVGIDDPTAKFFGENKGQDIPTLLSYCNPDLFTLLLYHQPRHFETTTSLLPIDLQLSGHTHGGQLFPFIHLTRIVYPMAKGFYEANGTKLYVSRGTGTWGPPLRFLSPPEIVVITLEHVTR
ncbi:MAG: metallophosphoesterase [Thermodesulfobacteriota bacterium]|nr:metallophosphoesterase [Thermodesulfobacteriota bacterium]